MDPGSFSLGAILLAATTTLHPWPASPRASARPMPRLDPVTMATWPAREGIRIASFSVPISLTSAARIQPALERRGRFSTAPTGQEAIHADVLVEVRPLHGVTVAQQ